MIDMWVAIHIVEANQKIWRYNSNVAFKSAFQNGCRARQIVMIFMLSHLSSNITCNITINGVSSEFNI